MLIIYSTPVLTEEKRTSGNLTFTDSADIPISGNIEISMTGAPSGGRSNVNSIKWSNAPNAWVYFDAIGTKSISINLRIAEDSPNGRVSLEDYGAALPGGVGEPAPGVPVKYIELRSTGVSFSNADVSIHYTDAELNGLDEKSLVIYSYDGGAWTELPTRVDVAKNIVSTAVDTLLVFAISARANGEKINKLMELTYPPEVKETIESDALKTKGVAVKLKINKRGDGQIKLEEYGRKNPVAIAPPGNAIKFVDISAENISFESAEVRIHYTDEELGDGDESALIIYHWNGGGMGCPCNVCGCGEQHAHCDHEFAIAVCGLGCWRGSDIESADQQILSFLTLDRQAHFWSQHKFHSLCSAHGHRWQACIGREHYI